MTVTGKRGCDWPCEAEVEERGVVMGVVLVPKVTMSALLTSIPISTFPTCDKSSLGGRGGGTPVKI